MQVAIDQLVQSFFNKRSLQDCSVEELESFAVHYPYFNIAQILLTKKLKEENWEAYTRNVQKTAIYYENPFWLDYILNQRKNIAKEENPVSFSVFKSLEEPFSTGIKAEENINVLNNVPAGEEEIKIAPLKTEPIPDENSPLTFEPLHTVDYFASQGIILKEEDKPADKFGKQLKSFTEWLKTLKKLPSAQITGETDSLSEKKVVILAEHSLEGRMILTEAMAEVWIKQGHPEKAIEVYNKLSLLEPSKSAYFAGLIEKLKES